MYAALLDTLDAKSIIGYLFGANLITRDVKQQICSATTTKDGNEILLDHLYDTATKESLVQFAAIISGDRVGKKVQQLGKELLQKLRQLKESSRCVTPCCGFIYIALFRVMQYIIVSWCLSVLVGVSHRTLRRMKN